MVEQLGGLTYRAHVNYTATGLDFGLINYFYDARTSFGNITMMAFLEPPFNRDCAKPERNCALPVKKGVAL